MKAGDIKKFLATVIDTEDRSKINPGNFNIHDSFLLSSINAYKNGDDPDHIRTLIESFITTEELTTNRRVAVLRMVRDVLTGCSKSNLKSDERDKIRSLLTAYFV